ncbi:hypothetical protein JCM11251_000580 [Rhodosporidiobolus azoricus]
MKRSSPPPTSSTAPVHDQPSSPKRLALDNMSTFPASSFLVQRLSEAAKLPIRGSALAAGYDISAAEDKVVPAQGKALISTGLAIAVPEGTYGRVAPRSGLASKHMIDTGAGVIDADYRGEVKVLLFNLSKEDFQVKSGDRIAQLILERIATPDVQEVASLSETQRGAGGFGSTGGFGAAAQQVAQSVVEAAKEGAVKVQEVVNGKTA